jgi:hypothetical protein
MPFLCFLSGDHKPGELFIGPLDKRIGFRILQVDVIFRLMLFDQRVLEKKRLHLGISDKIFDGLNTLNKNGCLRVNDSLLEITLDPLPDIFCFPDVDDMLRGISKEVTPGIHR